MEMTCKWLDLEPQTKEIPYDSRTKDLIEVLTQDSEDNPAGFIPIIELHNARLKKAHLLHAATSAIIQRKWAEGTDLEDIEKFLQSWAPEPYRNKPMPKGMIPALLGTAPNSKAWAPADLSSCIFRNTEAADSLGTVGGPTAQEPIKRTPEVGPDLIRIFPRMRSLHDTRRDWLSDGKLWRAIPEGETQRQCLSHATRHSWKLMVEIFLALNTNIGLWIQYLERRNMMLLGSLAQNIFGFTGTYAQKKQASLAPILTGCKRWVEFNSMIDDKMPRTGWILNLRMSGSISTNKVEKAVSWNVGPNGYKGSREEVHTIFEQGPPIICLQDVRIPKRRENSVKRELQWMFPHYWIYITTAQSPKKDCRDHPYVFSVLTALHSAFFPKTTQIRCPHSRQIKSDIRREIDGRLSITQARTPTGTTFQFMNIYQLQPPIPWGKQTYGLLRRTG